MTDRGQPREGCPRDKGPGHGRDEAAQASMGSDGGYPGRLAGFCLFGRARVSVRGAGTSAAAAGSRRRLVRCRAARTSNSCCAPSPARPAFRSPTYRPGTASRLSSRPGLPRAGAGRRLPARSRACSAGTRASTCWFPSTGSRAPRWQTTTTRSGAASAPSVATSTGSGSRPPTSRLIWYNIGVFERAGVVPPPDIDGAGVPGGQAVRSGTPAFAVGGADGWTLADWFSNLYLRLAGPARVRPPGRAPDPMDGSLGQGDAPAPGQGARPARHRRRRAGALRPATRNRSGRPSPALPRRRWCSKATSWPGSSAGKPAPSSAWTPTSSRSRRPGDRVPWWWPEAMPRS